MAHWQVEMDGTYLLRNAWSAPRAGADDARALHLHRRNGQVGQKGRIGVPITCLARRVFQLPGEQGTCSGPSALELPDRPCFPCFPLQVAAPCEGARRLRSDKSFCTSEPRLLFVFFFPPPLGRATMASSVRSVDPVPLEDRRNSFRSRSPSRSRSPTPRSDYSRSPSMDRRRYDDRDSRGRSPPRNGRYRSRSRGRSFSRSVSRSRSRSRSRSYSRGRSWSRGRSRSWSRTRSATPPMRSTKASETPQSACLCVFVCGGPWLTGIAM